MKINKEGAINERERKIKRGKSEEKKCAKQKRVSWIDAGKKERELSEGGNTVKCRRRYPNESEREGESGLLFIKISLVSFKKKGERVATYLKSPMKNIPSLIYTFILGLVRLSLIYKCP